MKKTNPIAGWACALVTLCCILIINPRVEMGINDDWSYIFTAKRLAETGHIYYNGWAAPILGVQLYLGALFVRLFGFSFTVVRASSMLFSILAVPVMHALLMRCGIKSWNATIGTLTLVLSPLYLPIATTFMSDGFAMLGLVMFFYACIRCVDAENDSAAIVWLIAAVAMGLVSGSVRQVAWLSVLIAIPCLAWQQRSRRRMLAAGVLSWLISLVSIGLLMFWFTRQPYVAAEKPIAGSRASIPFLIVFAVQATVTCLVLLSPLIFGVALRLPGKRVFRDARLAVSFLVTAAGIALLTYCYGGTWWGTWLLGDHFTVNGVLWRASMLGPRLVAIPAAVQVGVAVFIVASTTAGAAVFWMKYRSSAAEPRSRTDAALPWLILPFTFFYLLMVFTRVGIYDRYFVPLLLFACIAALRWYQRNFAGDLSRLCLLPIIMLSAYGVAGTHDMFAQTRAELAAANELQAAGLSRTEFDGGLEYNGWTQIALTGYVNEPRIRPASAYHLAPVPPGIADVHPSDAFPWRLAKGPERLCRTWFSPYTPSIHPRYVFETASGYCFTDSSFPPVRYSTWLPPHNAAIYIAEIPKQFQ